MGILAAGLAHELNNPIGSILLAAQNAKASPDRADECLDTILRNARRCASVVKSVLQVSRRDPAVREAVDVNDLVRRAVGVASDVAAERHATVHLQLQSDLAPIDGALPELEQAIANLVRNAAESGDGIEIRVATHGDADGVLIEVSDDGKGIAPDIRGRVFEPFFTTRQDEGGTGLGLSLVRAIVHAHGGRVQLESDQGTRVRVILPRSTEGDSSCSVSLS
ncbi:MAG: sensor histidine kinase [Planctomycetota bacterium]